jgi:hypothetical protein
MYSKSALFYLQDTMRPHEMQGQSKAPQKKSKSYFKNSKSFFKNSKSCFKKSKSCFEKPQPFINLQPCKPDAGSAF